MNKTWKRKEKKERERERKNKKWNRRQKRNEVQRRREGNHPIFITQQNYCLEDTYVIVPTKSVHVTLCEELDNIVPATGSSEMYRQISCLK